MSQSLIPKIVKDLQSGKQPENPKEFYDHVIENQGGLSTQQKLAYELDEMWKTVKDDWYVITKVDPYYGVTRIKNQISHSIADEVSYLGDKYLIGKVLPNFNIWGNDSNHSDLPPKKKPKIQKPRPDGDNNPFNSMLDFDPIVAIGSAIDEAFPDNPVDRAAQDLKQTISNTENQITTFYSNSIWYAEVAGIIVAGLMLSTYGVWMLAELKIIFK